MFVTYGSTKNIFLKSMLNSKLLDFLNFKSQSLKENCNLVQKLKNTIVDNIRNSFFF